MNQTILKYIEEILANGELDGLESSDDLLGSGILDSMGMMRLIAFIEETYNIKVAPEEMVIENFMTVDDICNFLKTKQ